MKKARSKFDGDGRFKIACDKARPGTRPMKVTRATARRLFASFLECGESNHSGMGGLLWVITEQCDLHGVPYRVEGERGFGYRVIRKQAPAGPQKPRK
jgi:hypothetical protein